MDASHASLDALFARFRLEKDPELLAEVFDQTAPRLLRLAIHLAGDPSEAEDLVQATFLTAIERAPSFDGTRPLVPWLLGILANHARSAGRKEQRTPDLDRLIAREQETPLEEAQRAEISGALARAIDELPEPYRQTLTLRLRHGMKPADIAHVLGKSPGAIRVRIHRGLEMLRERLPASFAMSALWFVPRARGLDAVRHLVVAKAAAGATAKGAVTIGGGIVSKKLLALGIAAVLLLLASVGVNAWVRNSREVEERASQVELTRADARTQSSLAGDTPQQAPGADRRAETTTSPESSQLLRVHVVEGSTDRPIAGARIEVFPSRRARYSDVLRRWSERFEVNDDGTFTDIEDTWPWLPAHPSDLARSGREHVEVCDVPLPGTPTLAEGSSGADGICELAVVGGATFIRCTVPGYEDRLLAPHERASTIRMWKPGRLAGYVIDPSGDRVHERLRLRFTGMRTWPESMPRRLASDDWAGQWIVDTDADGEFDAQFAADTVSASAVDAGWRLTQTGINPDNGHRWVFRTSFAPGKESGPVRLVAARCAVIVVVDADSQAPIESVSVFSRDPNGYPRWSGRFAAPGGRLRIPQGTGIEVTVWDDHHVPKTVRAESGRVELARGEPPRLEGIVRDAAGPKPGVVASVLGFGRLQWSETDENLIDAVSTDADGRFSLQVPEGEWMLRCTIDGASSCRIVQVPSAGPIVVDLSADAAVTVRIRDETGAARPTHQALLREKNGRQEWKETDERGETEFRSIPAGEYYVVVPKRPTKGSFSGGVRTEFSLRAGERKTVDVTVPVYDPRFARIVASPSATFDGWRASGSLNGTWTAVDADGRVPIDLQENVTVLRIESPDATRWIASIPENAPDGYSIRIDLGGRGYEGVLRDGTSGRPRARVRVLARPVDPSRPDRISASVVCGSDGTFRLTGLADESYELSFLPADDRDPHANDRPQVLFYPARHPGDPAVHMELELPRRDRDGGNGFEGIASHVVSGHVRVAGAARTELSLNVASLLPSDQGTFQLYPESAWCRVNDVGAYTVTIPFAPKHEVHVWDRATGKGFPPVEWDGAAFQPEEEVRDIELAE